MTEERMREIANAVLYEGYLLYPYRHSAIKNRQRWTIGVVYPRAYSEARRGGEPWAMRTECLLSAAPGTTLDVTVRFLHLLVRAPTVPRMEADADGASPMEDGRRENGYPRPPEEWEEGVEREVRIVGLAPGALASRPRRIPFTFAGGRVSNVSDPAVEDAEAGITREQLPVSGAVRIAAEHVDKAHGMPSDAAPVFKLSVEIENTTPPDEAALARRGGEMLQSLVSTHTLLRAHAGAFISSLDPPDTLSAAARGCRNAHTYPVLIGDEGERDGMLSSPIILYDYPRIAPESAGALFDGTEIDEILTLRILALSDDEKEELRHGDARAREILERTEALSAEQMLKLHGVIRGLRPAGESGKGDGA